MHIKNSKNLNLWKSIMEMDYLSKDFQDLEISKDQIQILIKGKKKYYGPYLNSKKAITKVLKVVSVKIKEIK